MGKQWSKKEQVEEIQINLQINQSKMSQDEIAKSYSSMASLLGLDALHEKLDSMAKELTIVKVNI